MTKDSTGAVSSLRSDRCDGVWREPAEETTDLYPGLVVHDGRHSGSITIGRTRLPLNAIIPDAVEHIDWPALVEQWNIPADLDRDGLRRFLYLLLDVRGEFARLLLLLAAAEARDDNPRVRTAWWNAPKVRDAVREQLRRCLDCLDGT